MLDELTHVAVRDMYAENPDANPDLLEHMDAWAEAEEAQARDALVADAAERSSEAWGEWPTITAEHHQEHVDIARPLVPDIDMRPAGQQNRIGQMMEVAQEALQGSVEPLAQDTVAEQDKGPLAALQACRGLKLEQADSELETELTHNPADWQPVVDKIVTAWPKLHEKGFPDDLSSELLLKSFNRYSIANDVSRGRRNDETTGQFAARDIEYTLEAMDIVGTQGIAVTEKFRPANNDGFISDIAYQLKCNADVDKGAIATSIEALATTADRLAVENPDLLAIAQKLDVQSPEDGFILAQTLTGVNERYDQLQDVLVHGQLGDPIMGVITNVRAKIALAGSRGIAPEAVDMFAGVDAGLALHQRVPGYHPNVIESVVNSVDDKWTEFAIGRLETPAVVAMLDDERGSDEVHRAANSIMHSQELDIDALVQATHDSHTELHGMMGLLAVAQPKKTETKDVYYALVHDHINSVDKNGTPYNSPDALARAAWLMSESTEEGVTAITWFTQGEPLPFAAFDTVIALREQAVVRGIEDTPQAIYEAYSHDAEFIAEMSNKHVMDYLTDNLAMTGQRSPAHQVLDQARLPELVQFARKEAHARHESFRIFLNLDADALLSAARDGGAIKSIMDTDVVNYDEMQNRGAKYVFHRSDVEVMMGNRSVSEADHPIYGSCGYVDQGVPKGAYGYGEIMLTFRPDESGLADRTTYTPEDSFHGTYRLSEEDARALRIIKTGASAVSDDRVHGLTSEYVEAQIKGGVNLAQVEHIYVEDEDAAEHLRGSLPAGIAQKVVARTSTRPFDRTSEKAAIQPFMKSKGGERMMYTEETVALPDAGIM